jgi:hypothetical protein
MTKVQLADSQMVQDRYDALKRMIREWRHLKMLKRTGRAHDPLGAEATAQGECAVTCPACPHPGKNLPLDWQETSPTRQYVFIYLAGSGFFS